MFFLFNTFLQQDFTEAGSWMNSVACSPFLHANINAATPIDEYRQSNDRDFNAYAYRLGSEFLEVFLSDQDEITWLDSGGGYGVAALQKISKMSHLKTTVINAQDPWAAFFEHQESGRTNLNKTWLRIAKLLKPSNNGSPVDLSSNLRSTLLSNQFRFKIGHAEAILPSLRTNFDLITDVFGSYFYSVDRISLIDAYYDSLQDKGVALVIIYAEDRHRFSTPVTTEKYGVVSNFHASEMSFEEVLAQVHPNIFKILEVSSSDGITKILRIKRDPEVNILNLGQQFEIKEYQIDKDHSVEQMRQVPQITVQTKPLTR